MNSKNLCNLKASIILNIQKTLLSFLIQNIRQLVHQSVEYEVFLFLDVCSSIDDAAVSYKEVNID